MSGPQTIPVPPTSLNWPPLGERWFHWPKIEACFWPKRGGRSASVDSVLAVVKDLGGLYVLGWSEDEPNCDRPHCQSHVKYIGETNWFKRRMGGFGASAGFWGEPAAGHSAGWSWPLGNKEKLWVAFFDVSSGMKLESHVWSGLRRWVEAVALEEHRLANNSLPRVNTGKRNVRVEFDG
jgi:hypothetical protein